MNLFKRKNELKEISKENIKKSKKIISLSSTYESSNEDEYDEIIDNCLKEKRVNNDKKIQQEFKECRNRNIAITGEYGCGKTSIINTFFAKHNEYKHINVSMGVYSSKDDNTENNIYTYILKQILYYVRPYCLPFSKYYRKDYPNWYYYIINSFFSLSLITLILIFLDIFKINSNWIKIPIMLLSMLILLMYSFSKINIKKISLDKVNVEIADKGIKLLNDNIEELINFFLSTKYTIVVFEDLDRNEKYLEIIRTLTQINYTINNSIHNKNKTIQFIYSVSDKCFSDREERTKFFDAIIPIKPYINAFNAKKMIIDLLKNNGIREDVIDNESLKFACNYLDNPRLVFDFVNHFSIYYNEQLNSKSCKELFFLVLYKISFPNRFHHFINKNNCLSLYYSEEFEKYVEVNTKQKWAALSNEDKLTQVETYIESRNNFKKDKNKEKGINEFEKQIIKSNVFYRNCDRLFIRRNDYYDNLSLQDENIVHKIKNNESIIDLKFKDVKSALEYIDMTDFQRDSILNVQLLKFVMKNNHFVLITQILNNLNTKKVEFIVENEEILQILKQYPNYNEKFWTVCALDTKKELTDVIKDKLLFYTIKYCTLEYISKKDTELNNYLTYNTSYLKLLDQRYDEIENKYVELDYKILSDNKFVKFKSKITTDIFTTNKFNITIENLNYFNRELRLGINNKKILQSVIDIKDELFKNEIFNNINEILKCYLDKSEKQSFEETDFVWLLENYDITEENVAMLIEQWDDSITDLSIFINNDFYFNSIVKNIKFKMTYENIKLIFDFNSQLLIEIKEYIVADGDGILADLKQDKEILQFISENILINLTEEEMLKWLNKFSVDKLSYCSKTIIINNKSVINKNNYHDLLKNDDNLRYILSGGHKIDKSYKEIIEIMDEIGIISSIKNSSEEYLYIYLKK